MPTLSLPASSCWMTTDTMRIAEHIDDVNPTLWDRFVEGAGLAMQRSFLRAIDQQPSWYATFHRGDQPVGVARLELATFRGPPVQTLLGDNCVTRIAAEAVGLSGPIQTTALICGSAFTGTPGFVLSRGADHELLDRAVRTIQREVDAPTVLMKEFAHSQGALELHGYAAMDGGPRMVLNLDPSWKTWQDYLAALRSKFRVKARRALSKSAAVRVLELDAQAIDAHADRIQHLLDAVTARADHQLGQLDVQTFVRLRAALPHRVVTRGYVLDEQLVGFSAALIDGVTLDAHTVGIDYAVNRKHSVYPRMLVDFLQLGLDHRCRRVDYGRTAQDIKSSLGARPQATTVYLRHRSALANPLLGRVARGVNVPIDRLRKPFRED